MSKSIDDLLREFKDARDALQDAEERGLQQTSIRNYTRAKFAAETALLNRIQENPQWKQAAVRDGRLLLDAFVEAAYTFSSLASSNKNSLEDKARYAVEIEQVEGSAALGELMRRVARKEGNPNTKAKNKSELKVKLAETALKLSEQLEAMLSGKFREALQALRHVNEGRKTTAADHRDNLSAKTRKAEAKSRGRLVCGETTHDLLQQVVVNDVEL